MPCVKLIALNLIVFNFPFLGSKSPSCHKYKKFRLMFQCSFTFNPMTSSSSVPCFPSGITFFLDSLFPSWSDSHHFHINDSPLFLSNYLSPLLKQKLRSHWSSAQKTPTMAAYLSREVRFPNWPWGPPCVTLTTLFPTLPLFLFKFITWGHVLVPEFATHLLRPPMSLFPQWWMSSISVFTTQNPSWVFQGAIPLSYTNVVSFIPPTSIIKTF